MAKYDIKKLVKYLEEKWGDHPCPMCGEAEWSVDDSTYELRQFNEGNLLMGGPVIPVAPVLCLNCGNTVLVNAVLARLVETDQGKEETG